MKPKTDFFQNHKRTHKGHRKHREIFTDGISFSTERAAERTTIKSRTIGSRLFFSFALFSIVIMVVLWLLQILFFQTFYQFMKISELRSTASTIETSFGHKTFYDTIDTLTMRSDIYVQVYVQVDGQDFVLYESGSISRGKMDSFSMAYNRAVLKQKLDEKNVHSITESRRMSAGSNDSAMFYASVLGETVTGESMYLFIYAPLSAVGTTIDILARMLIIITMLSIIFGLAISIAMSHRLARPINNITAAAAELAHGNYQIKFNGNGYAETEALAATLNYTAGELSKTDKLQKDLIANVSHDLKTPLTMVKSYAEMIRDLSGDNPEKRQKHLQVIISEADRLNELVNDLTKLSKMQANVDAITPEKINLEEIARESIDSFSIHSEQDGFQFILNADGSTDVIADSKKIKQVFSNLIGNAVRYSSDDKRIIVSLTEKKDCVRCEITDFGQGIAEKDLAAVWDRYYRSSSNHSRTSSGGTGLGLSIVKQIFILHGAKYGVNSKLDEGSTFWFELKKKL